MTDDRGSAPAPDLPKRPPPFKPTTPPSLGMPKSGGSVRGLGEKFQAGGPTGTGRLRVPISVSPCRDGAEPTLALDYDSGQGHGPFGTGWRLSVPSITRRTDKGIPRYADAEESDVFILSGHEDLVPVLTADGTNWVREPAQDGPYRVDAYAPRVEGSFARIERRTNLVTGDAHWRTITPDNVTSVYGLSVGARIADPGNPLHVFEWLLEATFDAFGNLTFYEYKPEDLSGVSASDVAEDSRRARPPANCYLKRIHYGNRVPLSTRNPEYADFTGMSWCFEAVFDYGEHTTDLPAEVAPWAVRADPFSAYRAGFEIRTYRLAQRVLMFHELPDELGAAARLVRATELGYDQMPEVTYLTTVREVGYAWDADGTVTTDSLPTLTLDYTRVGTLSSTVQAVDRSSLRQAPSGIDGQNYDFVDLDGEGIAGILAAAASPAPGLYYKRNLGGGRFGAAELLPAQPSLPAMSADARLVSLNADGRLDVARFSGPSPGYYERTRDFAWAPFTPFQSLPRIDFAARGVHFLDVDGDGLTDILVAEDDVFVWYSSLSRSGYGPPNRVTQAHDEDRGAVVLTTDDYETIFLADMSGDGLSDLVRIRNASICYWPNLGYGRFGAKVTMDAPPVFDTPDAFDPRRVRLGDIDGTGPTDIVYLSGQGAVVYFNQAGNGWAAGVPVRIPLAETMDSVRIADLLGTGTSCLVWSSADPADAGTALRYVDLLHSTKPHLLSHVDNGLGAQTAITYAPSPQFYLEDRQAGRPWATRLPFVVQTVAQAEFTDAVALTTCQVRYRYAHGFYDGVEREFRGFARVDSWDAESMSADHGAGVAPGSIDQEAGEYLLPPVRTTTWFHTGAWNGEQDDLRAALSAEYYAGDPLAGPLPPTAVPLGLLPPDSREAYRALKGRPLRREVYAEDGTDLAGVPYSVTEYRYEVRQVQPISAQRHGVYFPFEREKPVYHYERDSADPRITHDLTLEVDPLGHITRSAQVAYARRAGAAIAEAEQERTLATCQAATFADPVATLYDYRHGTAAETASYELYLAPGSAVLPLADVDAAMTGATVLPFDGSLAAGTMRTVEHVRHQYWQDDLSAPAPVGTAGTRALSYNHFALALPATLAAAVFGGRLAPGELAADAGYAMVDGDYWIQAGVITYDGSHFCQASSYADPFGNTANVSYDAARLFVVEEHTSADAAFDNVTTVTMDYRALALSLVTDPNGNRTAAAYDPLGMLAATAVMGRAGAGEGDTLADPTTRTDYHRLAWQDGLGPAYLHTYRREQYGPANPGWFESYSYFDGTGREVLKKTQAEPDADQNPRWAGTGRIVYDNKANPVKRYDPYFAPDPSYDSESALATAAYGAILRYDPASRVIRIDYPDGTFETAGWDAWTEVRSDPVDTVLDSAWYAAASARPPGDPLARAATLAARSANTPAVRVLDPLGRAFLAIADNGTAGQYPTRTALDIQGNALAVTDALGNLTRQQVFDAQQHVLRVISPDAGTSLAVGDVAGQLYRSWDPRGYAQLHAYDVLRRPARVWVTPPGGEQFLAEQFVYGEGLPGPNLRGHLYQHFDGAGVLTNAAYDLEARITQTTRQLAADYTGTPAWDPLAGVTDPAGFLPAALGLLEGDVLDTATTWDAMSRLVSVTTPDQTTVVPQYDAAARLGSVAVSLPGAAAPAPVVTSVTYNARGQRTSVTYADSISTEFTYDDGTRLVTEIRTTRQSDAVVLQDLSYTYDPVHNVVQVTDQAQQTVFFAGSVTSGTQLFEYDALYWLISAAGREQPGQVGYAAGPRGYPDPAINPLPHPNDLQALVAYSETYSYDAVGNLLATVHLAGGTSGTGWTRTQTYVAGSNRLDRASLPGDPAGGPYSAVYSYDPSGNIELMPNLAGLTWDYAGRLASVELAGGGSAYFAYDGRGQRVRKVIQRSGRIWERVYAGSYERYRERTGTSVASSVLTLERHTVHVSDGARRFALIETQTADSPTPLFRFQFPNHLGSACLETDQNGTVISYEEYYPYGGSSYRAGETDKRYRFAGQERDEETGFYCVGARYYVPWLARWASCDPAGAADGFNLYQYARSNPVRYTDPTGFGSDDDHDEGGGDAGGDDSSQMSLPLTGLTNPSFQGQYPVGTLRTEFLTIGGFQSRTDRSGSLIPTFQQYLSIGDRLSDTLELNVFGAPGNTQSSLGFGLHFGPPAPTSTGLVRRSGLWLTLSQVWGQEPPPPPLAPTPPGWSFNPTLNAFGATSRQVPNKRGLDVNYGGTASRWGSVVGVPVSGLVSPFAGVNLWRNFGPNDVLNLEATNTLNLGFGGRQDLTSPGGLPISDTTQVGFGWQHAFDKSDWALGLEVYAGYEGLSNITNGAGERHVLTGGLRFDFGAMNTRRNQYPQLPESMR